MKKLIHNENGITLVELLATLVLISLIGTLAYSLISQGYSNYQRINAESELRDEADIIMSTLVKDLFPAKSTEVTLVNSCSSDGYSITALTISKKNLPKRNIAFKPSSIEGKGIITVDDVPINFSDDVSLALYPCASETASSERLLNIKTDDQVSYTIMLELETEKNNSTHSMNFKNTINLINY